MFVCVLACSYYTPYSECKFMYGNLIKKKGILGNPSYIILLVNKKNLIKKKGILGNPSYIILLVNKKPNLMPTKKNTFFF